MQIRKSITIVLWVLSFSITTSALAIEPNALDIMNKVADRQIGQSVVSDMHFIITNKQGIKRERRFKMLSKSKDNTRMNLMFVESPKSLFNTGFLSLDSKNDTPQDRQWLYLSALNKTKRISTQNKSNNFLGSDFSYYDLTLLNTHKFAYTLLGTEMWNNNIKVWKIQAIAKGENIVKETGYRESLFWIRENPYLVLKAIHQTKNPHRHKEYKLKDYQKQEGVWVLKNSEMQSYYKNNLEQSTQSKINNVLFNKKLNNNLFNIRNLEKGI